MYRYIHVRMTRDFGVAEENSVNCVTKVNVTKQCTGCFGFARSLLPKYQEQIANLMEKVLYPGSRAIQMFNI